MKACNRQLFALGLVVLVGVLLPGCASVPLDAARHDYYAGRFDDADAALTNLPDTNDRILFLMERGMIRQARHDFIGSTRDWREAVQLEEAFETHSVTKAGASMVVNDSMLNYRGYPFERVLVHSFLARNYLAQGLWDDAAIEARNIRRRLADLDGFPDDAYSRYIAGFCLEQCGDVEGAALEYKTAATLAPNAPIDARTGAFLVSAGSHTNQPTTPQATELVCFVDIDGRDGAMPDRAEFYANGRLLGISHTLTDTAQLAYASERRMAGRRVAKEIARIGVKGAIAAVVGNQNKDLGQLVWFLLMSTETPDTRHWATLPACLAVARVPCPPDLQRVEVVFRAPSGATGRRLTLAPFARRGRTLFAFCRDYP